jgi:hypothetical protein
VLQYRALLDGIDYGTGRTGVPGDLVKTKTWLNWKDVPVASHISAYFVGVLFSRRFALVLAVRSGATAKSGPGPRP